MMKVKGITLGNRYGIEKDVEVTENIKAFASNPYEYFLKFSYRGKVLLFEQNEKSVNKWIIWSIYNDVTFSEFEDFMAELFNSNTGRDIAYDNTITMVHNVTFVKHLGKDTTTYPAEYEIIKK